MTLISATGSDCRTILQRAQSIPWAAEALRRVMPEEYSGQSKDIIQALIGNQTTHMTEGSLMVKIYLLANNLAYDYSKNPYSDQELRDWRGYTDENILHLWDILKGAGLERSKTFFSNPNATVSAIRDRCLSSALALGRLDILEVILDCGVDVNSPVVGSFLYSEYPIRLAAKIMNEWTSLQAVQMLLKHGAVPKENEYHRYVDDNETPLSAAIRRRHWVVAETLLEAGAPVAIFDMETALRVGNAGLCLRLFDAGGGNQSSSNRGDRCLTLLGLAVKQGDLELAKALVTRGENVNALQRVAGQDLLSFGSADYVYGVTTTLGLAAHAGDLEMCKLLIEEHAEIDAPMFSEFKADGAPCDNQHVPYLPLTIACGNGHIEIVRFLIDNGASVPVADKNGINICWNEKKSESFLENFIRKFGIPSNSQSCLDLCSLLIQKGALLDGALAASATAKNLDLVLLLLAHGAPHHAPTWSPSTKTALGAAIESGDETIAQSIYDAGGAETGELEKIPNEEMMQFMACNGLLGPALLQYASAIVASAIRGPDENKTLLRRILEHGIDLSNPGVSSNGPLEIAIREGSDLKLIELLLQLGAPVRLVTLNLVVYKIANLRRDAAKGSGSGTTHKTQRDEMESFQIQILNLLLKYMPDAWKHGSRAGSLDSCINQDTGIYPYYAPDCPAIIVAAKNGLRDIVQILLRSVCWGPRHVGAALTAAIDFDNYLVVKDLLDIKPSPPPEESLVADSDRYFDRVDLSLALVAAAGSGRISLARTLLERGAMVNCEANKIDETALQEAARQGHYEMVEFLLNHKADPNAAPSKTGATALQFAAMSGQLLIVHKLLASGADVNQAGCWIYSRTAVEAAAEHGRLEILDLLLRHGGKITCNFGQDITHTHAVWLAKARGHMAAARLLMSQEEFANLGDDSDRPTWECDDESSSEKSEAEPSAATQSLSAEMGHVSDAETDSYFDKFEVRSAGITEGMQSQNHLPWPDFSLMPELQSR